MGKTITIRFENGKPVPPRTKDPKRRAMAFALGQGFLDNPGAAIVTPNPDLPDEARGAAQAIVRNTHVGDGP